MTHAQRRATDTLQHYFALAMGLRSASDLSEDARNEIADIVDAIIAAAVVEARDGGVEE